MTAQRDLPQLARDDAEIRYLLENAGIGHRTCARQINEMRGEGTTSEKSVRRYRSRATTAEALAGPQPAASPKPAVKGSGGSWQPGIDIDPREGGEFRTRPREVGQPTDLPQSEPEEAELLAEWDLDPAVWEVTSARKSLWQSGDKWLEARRVSFRRRAAGPIPVADVESIMSRYTVPAHPGHAIVPERLLLVPAGDLQLGKSEGGGTAATVERFCRIVDDIASEIQRGGFNTSLILAWLGDCIEGIVSQRGKLIASLDMPVTEQVRVYRRLMMHAIGVLAPLVVKLLIPVVPGNHDETTREQNMPVSDSWAIEGASAVADWMSGRPGFEHVEFVFPEPEELGITVDVGSAAVPYVVSFHHGHTASRPEGIIPWWKNQAHGRQHAGRADLLVTAHFHHLRVEHTGGNRTWLQIPALDGGSGWYRRRSGEEAVTGLATIELTPGTGQGWRNLTVHS